MKKKVKYTFIPIINKEFITVGHTKLNAKTRKIIGILLVLLGFGMISGFLICVSIYMATNWSQTHVCIILLVFALIPICIGYGNIMEGIKNPDKE